MQLQNETRCGVHTGLAKASSLAGSDREYSTSTAVVQKLQRLYRVSEPHAATIMRLAALGPREAR